MAVVIPARYASSRFPGKPLVKIDGVPLVARVHERVVRVVPPAQVFVATEDARIREVCEAMGINVLMTPSSCLTGTDRVWEASKQLNARLIVNVQGDEPLIEGEDILAVIAAKRAHPNEVTNAMCKIHSQEDVSSPNVPKVLTDEAGRLVYASRAPVPFVKAAGYEATYYRQVCIYGFTPSELEAFASLGRKSRLEAPEDIEILRFLDLGIPVRMVQVGNYSVAVDVPEDVARVERILAQGRERSTVPSSPR